MWVERWTGWEGARGRNWIQEDIGISIGEGTFGHYSAEAGLQSCAEERRGEARLGLLRGPPSCAQARRSGFSIWFKLLFRLLGDDVGRYGEYLKGVEG